MPIFEFQCPIHGKFERILPQRPERKAVICLREEPDTVHPCTLDAELVEWSVGAWRNPSHGIQT